MSNNEQQADDPSGPGWRDVLPSETLQPDDVMRTMAGLWLRTTVPGRFARDGGGGIYRRRIEPQQQPSDSEPETMEDLRKRLATLHNLAEMSRRQVADEAQKIEQLKEQVQDLTRQVQFDAVELQQLREQVTTLTQERDWYHNQLEGALEHSSKGPRNFRERMVLEKYRSFVEAKNDDPLTSGYVQLRATDPHVLRCSEFVVESWHQDVGGGRLSESVRVFLRHYASEEDQESRKESSARTYFHVKTVGDYERLLSLLGIGGNE